MTAKERLATLEAHQHAHAREHDYQNHAWEGQLEAIILRLANIEQVLNGWKSTSNGVNGRRRVSNRDLRRRRRRRRRLECHLGAAGPAVRSRRGVGDVLALNSWHDILEEVGEEP